MSRPTENQERRESLPQGVELPKASMSIHENACKNPRPTFSSNVLSACHFHPVSSLTRSRLPASTSGDNSILEPALPGLTEGSDKLPSRRPMYEVLESRAMNTSVWIG